MAEGHFKYLKHQIPLITIAVTSVLCITISIFVLKSGYFIVFQNLFYIPIIISCFFYKKRGFIFSVILACIYLMLILAFTKESSVILLAVIRAFIFIFIAGIITYMSLLHKQVKELRITNVYTRSLIEASLDPLLVIAADGKVMDVNAATETATGYTRTELIGTEFSNYFTEPEHVRSIYQDVLLAHSHRNEPLEIRHRDGHVTFVLYNASLCQDEKGQIVGVFAAARDITDHKQAEESLRESEERFHDLYENAPVAYFSIGTDGLIRQCNKSASEMLGYGVQEILGRPILEFYADTAQGKEKASLIFKRFLEGEAIVDKELQLQKADGTRVWGSLTVNPVRNTKGQIMESRSVIVDITERKQAENELKQYHNHLEELVRERTIELEAFSYSVSHDLRAPLRTIDGFSQAILEDYEDKLDAQGKDYLLRIRTSTQFMGQLIADMLKLYRITSTEIDIAQVNLTQIAISVINELQQSQPERLVDIKIADGLEDSADPRLIHIALENLFGNAWKFTEKQEKAEIEFGTTKKDGKKVYFIRDNGTGFDMEHMDKLFAPFQRLHSVAEYPGTGIGLATVRRVISRHGGKVWAEGKSGRGATFYFTLQQ